MTDKTIFQVEGYEMFRRTVIPMSSNRSTGRIYLPARYVGKRVAIVVLDGDE